MFDAVRMAFYTSVIIFFWAISSISIHSLYEQNICLDDKYLKDPSIVNAIEEVLILFNKEGLNIKRSCDDISYIRITTAPFEEKYILGKALNQGFVLEDKKFLPFLNGKFQREIIFNRAFFAKKIKQRRFSKYYFQLTLIHEIGHILGIGHIDHEQHIMNPTIHFISLDKAIRQVKELSYVNFNE